MTAVRSAIRAIALGVLVGQAIAQTADKASMKSAEFRADQAMARVEIKISIDPGAEPSAELQAALAVDQAERFQVADHYMLEKLVDGEWRTISRPLTVDTEADQLDEFIAALSLAHGHIPDDGEYRVRITDESLAELFVEPTVPVHIEIYKGEEVDLRAEISKSLMYRNVEAELRHLGENGIGLDFDVRYAMRVLKGSDALQARVATSGIVASSSDENEFDAVKASGLLEWEPDAGMWLGTGVKYEATQDFENYDVAFTVQATALPRFGLMDLFLDQLSILDFASEEPRLAGYPVLSVGYDFVTQADETNRAARVGKSASEYSRAFGEVTWELPVWQQGTFLQLHGLGVWDLDAGEAAPHDGLNGFIEVSLIRDLGGDVEGDGRQAGSPQLIFTWQDGSLAPEFINGTEFSVGIGVTF